ncbi:MAG: TRAP transporter substrate-binding protein [Burkholderiales bacterium]|nr:MAG: TRAP transporter substrate-binding protein [Burkholderiales bacterium]
MRSPILAVVAVAAALVCAPLQAQTVWRMATKMPPDGPEGKVFQYFADQAEKYSGGELKVQVYPNEQLGKEAAVLEQLKLGTVHLYAEGSTFMAKWVPELRWMSAAFVFKDRDHWVRFVNSPTVQGWLETAKNDAGIGILGDPTAVLRGPYRVMLTQKPIRSLADLGEVKMRMANSKTGVEQWKHLGAEVRVLGWAETYESISRGIVNAVTSPVALVESMKFYEVAPHITRTDEYWQSIAFMMNQKAFDGLPKAQQEALLKAHQDAAAYSVKVMNDVVGESIARMKSKGATYSELDMAPFVDRMQSYYDQAAQSGTLPKAFMAAVKSTAR